MDDTFVISRAHDVRALIARLMLAQSEDEEKLGTITLAPHQSEAVGRIRRTLDEFRGAFLCDTVGSGKTYIALAVARDAKAPVIIAPAALRAMWMTAIDAAAISARFVGI